MRFNDRHGYSRPTRAQYDALRKRLDAVRALAEVVARLQPADPLTGDRDVSWLALIEALED